MEIVTGDQAPTVERADAVRLLHEMAAVARTIFAVDATAVAEVVAHTVAPSVPVPAPVPTPAPAPVAAGTPASIPVPGATLLHEIAFLDD